MKLFEGKKHAHQTTYLTNSKLQSGEFFVFLFWGEGGILPSIFIQNAFIKTMEIVRMTGKKQQHKLEAMDK
jgi:hypothetical protein